MTCSLIHQLMDIYLQLFFFPTVNKASVKFHIQAFYTWFYFSWTNTQAWDYWVVW